VNVLGGMSALGRLLPPRAVPRRTGGTGAGERAATLVGPLCTPADVLSRSAPVPADLAPGDVLAIPNVGAYGLTASLVGFLSRPSPVEIVVRGDEVLLADRPRLVRERIAAPFGTRPQSV
jgi:diaminopimelate decarboxylase